MKPKPEPLHVVRGRNLSQQFDEAIRGERWEDARAKLVEWARETCNLHVLRKWTYGMEVSDAGQAVGLVDGDKVVGDRGVVGSPVCV